MAVIAGIDEAGLGPVLGPLVVSATAFALPDELADVSLWKLLAGTVSRKPSRRHASVAVADSKKLYSGLKDRQGLEHLERGVLAMLAAAGRRPASLGELMEAVAPSAWKAAQAYPWYAGNDLPLPHALTSTSVALSGNSLLAGLTKAGVDLLLMRSEPVFTGEYNRLVEAVRNKASLLFDVTGRLLWRLWAGAANRRLSVYVDHHGGRVHYLPGLQRLFDGCRFKVLEESPTVSAYRISGPDREAEVCFAVGCEERQLPVALASMLSKYLRELCMAMFNRFWASHVPGLAPTAGYYTDGRRFFEQIRSAAGRLGVEDAMLYRSR